MPKNESFFNREKHRIMCNVSIITAKIGTFRNLIINGTVFLVDNVRHMIHLRQVDYTLIVLDESTASYAI